PSLTRELETSISLDPNFADSYALLAFAQTTSGDPAKAVETMARAITLDPRNENYRFNLAKIYLANHQMDKARSVLESLRNATTPGMAASADTALSSMQQVEQEPQEQPNSTALTLVRRGDPEPARSSDTNTPSAKSEPAKWGAPIF